MAFDFRYRARTSAGEVIGGSMRARDRNSVLLALRSRALFVTSVVAETPIRRTLNRSLSIGRVALMRPTSRRCVRWPFMSVSPSPTLVCTSASARAARRRNRLSASCGYCATRSTSTKCF